MRVLHCPQFPATVIVSVITLFLSLDWAIPDSVRIAIRLVSKLLKMMFFMLFNFKIEIENHI